LNEEGIFNVCEQHLTLYGSKNLVIQERAKFIQCGEALGKDEISQVRGLICEKIRNSGLVSWVPEMFPVYNL
jgi:hypothetical protein